MKPGDLVRHTQLCITGTRVGLVIGTTEKKCWRTSEQGKKINWDIIDPELHAVVMYPGPSKPLAIPVVDLEVVSESG